MKLYVVEAIFLLIMVSTKRSLQQSNETNDSNETSSEPGVLTIDVEPSNWVNYTKVSLHSYAADVNVTFRLDPPCASASIFRQDGMLPVCIFGPFCLSSSITYEADLDGAWFRVNTTLPTGNYFAQCMSPEVRLYKTNTNSGPNIKIGVNPSVLRITVKHPGEYVAYELLRSSSSTGGNDVFESSQSISMDRYATFQIEIAVGKGKLPDNSLATSARGFTFDVPDFDLPKGRYSFARKSSRVTTMMKTTPDGEWHRYSITKTDMAAAGLCQVEGRAVAHLHGAQSADVVDFRFSLRYNAQAGAILLERNNTSQGSCECLFTCNITKCPGPATITSSRWGFADRSSERNLQGNVPGQPDKYLLSPKQCQEMFRTSKHDADSKSNFKVMCSAQVSGAVFPPTRNEPLYELFRSCNASEFQCTRNLQCIPSGKQCNGVRDCIDGTDEEGCVVGPCRFGDFHCQVSGNGSCIPSYKICDGKVDCGNGADEEHCVSPKTPCGVGYFRCANGRCTRGRYVCDADNDCRDGSDEQSCGSFGQSTCRSGYFICKNRNCVSRVNICDGTNDCGDNSDEEFCGTYYSAACGSSYWQCANSKCISAGYLCDGDNDCGDDSDESVCSRGGGLSMPWRRQPPIGTTTPVFVTSCLSSEFACNNGRCIDRGFLCNGNDNCGDYSDELAAPCSTCRSGQFHCSNNVCVNEVYVCDNDNDCGDGSDEAHEICGPCLLSNGNYPPMWRCKTSNKCIHISRVCNEANNCGSYDTSDESTEACRIVQELAVKPFVCPEGTIKCATKSACVQRNRICNGVSDCCESSYSYLENSTHIGSCEKTDEIGCNATGNATCSRDNGSCQGICISILLPPEESVCGGLTVPGEVAYCSCASGFIRPFDNATVCIDIDECASPFTHNCSQHCTNTPGSYSCTCVDGFVDEGTKNGGNETGLCTPAVTGDGTGSPGPIAVFALGDSLRIWQENKSPVLHQTDFFNKTFTALEVDIRNGTVIFAEAGVPTLFRTAIPRNKDERFEPLAMASNFKYNEIIDMAIDFVGDNLYVTDTSLEMRSRIVVSRSNGLYPLVIINTGVQITCIAVNPLKGILYYATHGQGGPYVSASNILIMTSMNGSQSSNVEIYSTVTGGSIATITVDYTGDGRLYFADESAAIILANYDGSGQKTFSTRQYPASKRAFDVFGNFLFGVFSSSASTSYSSPYYYYSYSGSRGFNDSAQMLYELDKFNRGMVANLSREITGASNVRLYHHLKAGQPENWPNPCQQLNCSHLCLLGLEGDATCACPNGPNRQSCEHSSVLPEPDHPTNCPSNCIEGQGICFKNKDGTAMECICNKLFLGKYCNETAMPELADETNQTIVIIHQPVTVINGTSGGQSAVKGKGADESLRLALYASTILIMATELQLNI